MTEKEQKVKNKDEEECHFGEITHLHIDLEQYYQFLGQAV